MSKDISWIESIAMDSACDDHFGWELHHDTQHNLLFYVHTYTGEVRWLPPEQVGFVMNGLKPLPASTEAGGDWNPFYPHVVMGSTGLLRVHPIEENDVKCGYNRFPLKCISEEQKRQFNLHFDTNGYVLPKQRLLPPTWEPIKHGSPFLPPYPVAVLPNTASDNPINYRRSKMERLQAIAADTEWIQMTQENPISSYEDRRVHCQDPSQGLNVSNDEYELQADPKLMARVEKRKEHNRRGYTLRQNRKWMKALGLTKQPRDEFYRQNQSRSATIPSYSTSSSGRNSKS